MTRKSQCLLFLQGFIKSHLKANPQLIGCHFLPQILALMRSQTLSNCVQSWGQCYKTFFVRNLRIFVKVRVFVHGKPFQPSLIFAGKAEAYPSEAPERFSTLG
jgi:hypothetical protein